MARRAPNPAHPSLQAILTFRLNIFTLFTITYHFYPFIRPFGCSSAYCLNSRQAEPADRKEDIFPLCIFHPLDFYTYIFTYYIFMDICIIYLEIDRDFIRICIWVGRMTVTLWYLLFTYHSNNCKETIQLLFEFSTLLSLIYSIIKYIARPPTRGAGAGRL